VGVGLGSSNKTIEIISANKEFEGTYEGEDYGDDNMPYTSPLFHFSLFSEKKPYGFEFNYEKKNFLSTHNNLSFKTEIIELLPTINIWEKGDSFVSGMYFCLGTVITRFSGDIDETNFKIQPAFGIGIKFKVPRKGPTFFVRSHFTQSFDTVERNNNIKSTYTRTFLNVGFAYTFSF